MKDRLLGWLTTRKGDSIAANVPVRTDIATGAWSADGEWELGETAFEERTFYSRILNYRQTKVDMIRAGHDGFPEQVPLYARVRNELAEDARLFTWKVLHIHADEAEWLFDRDFFDPVDTEVDIEAIVTGPSTGLTEAALRETARILEPITIKWNTGLSVLRSPSIFTAEGGT